MKKKIDVMRELWDAGNYRAALKLAASWPRLGDHEKAIKGGWAATWNPGFYRQLGKCPATLYRLGLEAMAARYELEPAKDVTLPNGRRP